MSTEAVPDSWLSLSAEEAEWATVSAEWARSIAVWEVASALTPGESTGDPEFEAPAESLAAAHSAALPGFRADRGTTRCPTLAPVALVWSRRFGLVAEQGAAAAAVP